MGTELKGAAGSSAETDTSGFDVKYLALVLNVNDTTIAISGEARYLIELTSPDRNAVFFNLSPSYTVESVKVNNMQQTIRQNLNGIRISVPPADTNNLLDIRIAYKGEFNSPGDGISSASDLKWKVPVTWTLSEPFAAKNWFPVKEFLSDKIDSSDLSFHVPPGRKAGSNGLLVRVDTLDDNSLVFHWKSRYPIAFYLVSFSVGKYQEYNVYAHLPGMKDSLLVQNYLYDAPGILDRYRDEIGMTTQFLGVFSELFGLYPFSNEKYGHCMAPLGGGMEHQTMTTLSNFNYNLVAHELAHMWFGDQVTCASWNDIWLNEGFASYAEYLALEKLISREKADEWMRIAQMAALNSPQGSVFVPQEEAWSEARIFNSNLSYKKGAAIIHMIRYELGNDSIFFEVLRDYLVSFQFSTSSTLDFKTILEKHSGRSFSHFFNEWYYGKGYPSLSTSWYQQDGILGIDLVQEPSSSFTPVFTFQLQIKLLYLTGDTLLLVPVTSKSVQLRIPLSKKVRSIQVDPDNWLLKKSTVYGIRNEMKYLNVYPNPTGRYLTLHFPDASRTRIIEIMNPSGNRVLKTESREEASEVDVSTWGSGAYIIRVWDGERYYSTRIIRQ